VQCCLSRSEILKAGYAWGVQIGGPKDAAESVPAARILAARHSGTAIVTEFICWPECSELSYCAASRGRLVMHLQDISRI
jgi:hypothetical protein